MQALSKNSWVRRTPFRHYLDRLSRLIRRRKAEGDRGLPSVDGHVVPNSAVGTLRISTYRDTQGDKGNVESRRESHHHSWVVDSTYAGMEDNDLRGFLDGRFKFAWNQPSQIHVRLGRVNERSKFGEWELFRFVQRWVDVWLPPQSRVTQARIELTIEEGINQELELFLYDVHKDWNPGNGGVQGDNLSLPARGEVWWNEAGHETRAWGLPGAGFSSDQHPEADTGLTPLARAIYRPGDPSIVFQGTRLTTYVDERIQLGRPLLFLFKLSDYLEDIPGSDAPCVFGESG